MSDIPDPILSDGLPSSGRPKFPFFTDAPNRLTQEEMARLGEREEKIRAQRGAKHDAGKIRAGVIILDFPNALEAVAKVATFGCQKYAPHSWSTVPDGDDRYFDAMIRHMLAEAKGEIADNESGIDHFAHVAWNALALLELHLRRVNAPKIP